MSKNIIILNGSPRLKGNTAMLCDAFMKGAESAGHAVTRFDLQKLDIHGCLGCMKGGKNPASPCVQKDGMEAIYPAYRNADLVVLASPMYYWSVSGQLKTVFDRLFAVAECDPNYANPRKECARQLEACARLLPCVDRFSELDGQGAGAGRGYPGRRRCFRPPRA